MSKREQKVIAVAGALQAKSFDLTKYRQRSLVERRLTLRSDVAAGMLAFGAVDVVDEEGFVIRKGDPLPGLLLELKIARHVNLDRYSEALTKLVGRYGGLVKDADTTRAVAGGALFEWIHDQCPECRQPKAGTRQPRRCECTPLVAANQDDVAGRPEGVQTSIGVIQALTTRPKPGCIKCKGSGRIFRDGKESRGMLCARCGNSGRIDFKGRDRCLFVNDYLTSIQRSRGQAARGMKRDTFNQHWMRRYMRFLEVLRAIEKKIGAGLDMGWESSPSVEIQVREDDAP